MRVLQESKVLQNSNKINLPSPDPCREEKLELKANLFEKHFKHFNVCLPIDSLPGKLPNASLPFEEFNGKNGKEQEKHENFELLCEQKEQLVKEFRKISDRIAKIKQMSCPLKLRIHLLESTNEKLQSVTTKLHQLNEQMKEYQPYFEQQLPRLEFAKPDSFPSTQFSKDNQYAHGELSVRSSTKASYSHRSSENLDLFPWEEQELRQKLLIAKEHQANLKESLDTCLEDLSDWQQLLHEKRSTLQSLHQQVQQKMHKIAKLSRQGLTTPNFIQQTKHFRDGSIFKVLNMDLSSTLDAPSHLQQMNNTHNMTKIEISRVEFGNRSRLSVSSFREISHSVRGLFGRRSNKTFKDKILPDDI